MPLRDPVAVNVLFGAGDAKRLRAAADRMGITAAAAVRQATLAWLGPDQAPTPIRSGMARIEDDGPGHRGRLIRRVLALLVELGATGRARSAVELAERLGRTDRTIRRDLEVLRACGIEVEVIRDGREISYRLPQAAIPVVCARCARGGDRG